MEFKEAFTLPLRYNVLPTFGGRIDAVDLGRSLRGVGRLSNLVIQTMYSGEVPERRTVIEVRFHIGPPKRGSIGYDLTAILGSVQLPIWWNTFQTIARPLFEYLIAAVISARIGRDHEREKMIDLVRDQVANDHAFRTLVQIGHLKDKERLYELIARLVGQADRSMRDAAAPVGRSSGPIDIGGVEIGHGVRIDEPAAEVLRAKEDLAVGEQQTFRVRFSAVDKLGKRCKVEIVGQEGQVITGRITDPALMSAGNIYTRSLDTHQVAEIQAKPVLRDDGVIRTLYISDGREVS